MSRASHHAYRTAESLNRLFRATRSSRGIFAGFVLGVVVNAFSDERGLAQTLAAIYDPRRSITAYLAILITSALLLLPVSEAATAFYLRRKSDPESLADLYDSRADEMLRPYRRYGLVWGEDIVLQICPHFEVGWDPSDLLISRRPRAFSVPQELRLAYGKYVSDWNVRDAPFMRGTRFGLAVNPVAFSDSPNPILEVESTPWSYIQFFRDNILPSKSARMQHVERAFKGSIDFPNAFCLHLVVASSDDHVLLTRRSDKVRHYPGVWSCSVEEHLDEFDLAGPPDRVVERWASRLLSEELGIRSTHFDTDNLRLFAVFLEADLLNCAIAGLITLNLSKNQIEGILRTHPRNDYEMQDWTFIPWSEVANELLNPSKNFNPSTGIRMFMGGVSRFGEFRFSNQLKAARR